MDKSYNSTQFLSTVYPTNQHTEVIGHISLFVIEFLTDMRQVNDLITIFECTFFQSHNTRLVKGDSEPIYIPANNQTPFHQIVFAHGFYASALHELAHWLVAGEKRRELEDYGYWYCPDGRDSLQQAQFENVEVLPQAIEWLLSCAAGFKFNVSVDNLNGQQTCRFDFQARVHEMVLLLLKNGVNDRTNAFLKALSEFYNTPWPLNTQQFVWQHPKVRCETL